MGVVKDKIVAIFEVKFEGKTISTLELPRESNFIIGRGEKVGYQIKSTALSRQHCQISHHNKEVILRDLKSLNGTFVNRKKVKRTILQNNDQIQIGPIVIDVKITDSSPSSSSDCDILFPEKGTSSRRCSPVVYEQDFPEGICVCGQKITQKEMSTHGAVFREKKGFPDEQETPELEIYCLSCFCEGKGDFPSFGGYRIVKRLGGGGMGEVYEAIQLSMKRPVAFKLMKGLENATEQQKKRFFREAHTGGKLHHPNIVSFIDSGRDKNFSFIVMEFIYGIDLRHLLAQRGTLPYQEAVRVAYYIARALEYASKHNIIHRDIKPENILVDRDNVIKLTDFGLAKNLEGAGVSEITKSQTGVGTLFYMAPEQITNAKNADQRADIYSLGVTLYEALTGIRPFSASQMMQVVNKIRHEKARPVQDLAQVPEEICQIIDKAMAKNPEHRFQTPREMLEALKPFLEEESELY